MQSVSMAIIVGNVGTIKGGKGATDKEWAYLSVATSTKYKKANGETQEDTTWHAVSCFGKLAEFCNKHVEKGKRVYIEGTLKKEIDKKDNIAKAKIVAKQLLVLN